MSVLFYILAYAAFVACVAIIVAKCINYLKKPVHLRWELYPVAHEEPERVAYGGSYLEDSDWWKHKQQGSVLGALKGFLMEALFLHATYEHNRSLWVRSYPFHIGLYVLVGSFGLTLFAAFSMLAGHFGWFLSLCVNLAMLCNFVGFLGVLVGSLGLIQRRLADSGLRKFSTPEHFFNLGLFAVFAVLGLLQCLLSPQGFALMGAAFFTGMLTFQPIPLPFLYAVYLLVSFFILVWVPFSFMGHAFMKYFTWHDIRWGDQPTQDSPKIQAEMARNLQLPVTWKGPHVQGDGRKTWAEIATSLPTKQDKE